MTELSSTSVWLLALGGVHGINPGMGWLFAVALGLQERSARAVWRALLPLSLGHALAIGAAVVPALLLGLVLPAEVLEPLVAGSLVAFAIYRLWRRRHPHFGGMRVGMGQLTVWSLLMASAHGAGLMVVPVLLADRPTTASQTVHAHPAHHDAPFSAGASRAGETDAPFLDSGMRATLFHTAGYLLVTGLVALVVYSWAGLRLLRAAWVNLDRIWAGALIGTAALTMLT